MNKAMILVLILVFSVTLFSTEIKNTDKPLKGTWDFSPQKVWETQTAGDDPLVDVRQIRVDDKGNIYLMEGKYSKLYVFDTDGKFRFAFGKKGSGPGEYRFAFTFFLVEQYVIVPDMGRLHYFDKRDGKFVKTEVLGTMGLMPRMFIDSGSFLFVPDNQGKQEGKDSLMRYDLASKKREPVVEVGTEKPMNLSGSAGGGHMVIKVIDPATKPGVVQFLKNNKLYYGKSDDYKIKAIDLKGTELLSFSLEGRERKKISQAFKKKRTARFKINGGPLPPEMAKQMMARIPDQATYFNRLLVDDKGYVYVFISDVENENSQAIDIFSPKGEFLYRSQIAAPEDYSFNGRGFVLKGDHLYVVLRDEEEELSLAKFKINSL